MRFDTRMNIEGIPTNLTAFYRRDDHSGIRIQEVVDEHGDSLDEMTEEEELDLMSRIAYYEEQRSRGMEVVL